jgi:hypothetical protein
MSLKNETTRHPERASTDERRPDGLASFGLLHLAACLATAIAVIIAISLVD